MNRTHDPPINSFGLEFVFRSNQLLPVVYLVKYLLQLFYCSVWQLVLLKLILLSHCTTTNMQTVDAFINGMVFAGNE